MRRGGSALLVLMKIKSLICPGLLVALVAAASVSAQQLDSELTVFGAYRFGGEVDVDGADAIYEAQDSPSYGLIWNTRHKANTQWEVYFSAQDTEVELSDPLIASPVVDIELYSLELGGTYLWERQGSVQPYLSATLGGTHIKANVAGGDSDTFISASLGVGIKMRPSERIGFRLEARMHGVFVRDSTELFCRTGPDLNVCAVRLQGDVLGQLETFAGITYRF